MKKGTVFNGSLHSTRGVELAMHVDDESIAKFDREVYGIISKCGSGATELVQNAVDTILANSNAYVPTDTYTLMESGYAKVNERTGYKLKDIPLDSSALSSGKAIMQAVGEVGYGDDSATGTINPKTGMRPSQYAWKVHEDLTAKHPNGGQAKFLERAYREYIAEYLGSELVQLERTVLVNKKYVPLFSYSAREKRFSGWGTKKNRTKRTKDEATNLDRLTDIYNKASGR